MEERDDLTDSMAAQLAQEWETSGPPGIGAEGFFSLFFLPCSRLTLLVPFSPRGRD